MAPVPALTATQRAVIAAWETEIEATEMDARRSTADRQALEDRMRGSSGAVCVARQDLMTLLNQDTFHWGTIKGAGKIYVQVVVDAFCSLAFAKVYASKMPVTAAELLYDRVLPFYEALGVEVKAVLTDNGREFCGRPEHHAYELMLSLHDIERRRTKVRSPRTNGFVERMNRTLLDECFRVKGRSKWCDTPEEIQRDLDEYLAYCNLERSRQGYRLKGRTPAQALREALGKKKLPPVVPKEEKQTPKQAA